MSASTVPSAGVIPYGVLLLIAVLPSVGRANFGPRWQGGLAAEPQGLKEIAITEEHLTLDLRPLVRVEPIEVEAIYRLDNRGPEKHLDLVFVSGTSYVSDFEVRLDDRPLDSRKVPIAEAKPPGELLPPPWTRPRGTPERDWPGSIHYGHGVVTRPTLIGFSVGLPHGRHTLAAHYHTRAVGGIESYPTTNWQVPYILAPAREWGKFGALHVTAYVPPRWECTSEPPLERNGDRLHGDFDHIPADLLVINTQAPVPPALLSRTKAGVACYMLALVLGGALCWYAGARHARWRWCRGRAEHPAPALTAGLMALIWVGFVYTTWCFVVSWIYAALGGQGSPGLNARFEALAIGNVLVLLLVALCGLFLTRLGARRQWRRFAGGTSKTACSLTSARPPGP